VAVTSGRGFRSASCVPDVRSPFGREGAIRTPVPLQSIAKNINMVFPLYNDISHLLRPSSGSAFFVSSTIAVANSGVANRSLGAAALPAPTFVFVVAGCPGQGARRSPPLEMVPHRTCYEALSS